jgi:hypothetical protein
MGSIIVSEATTALVLWLRSAVIVTLAFFNELPLWNTLPMPDGFSSANC